MSCLAITFTGPKTRNGRRLFENFVQANKSSFWNRSVLPTPPATPTPHRAPFRDLVEAVDSLIFMGFMRPCTLFISGLVTNLQALRVAWARRVLKAAEGYMIAALGKSLLYYKLRE